MRGASRAIATRLPAEHFAFHPEESPMKTYRIPLLPALGILAVPFSLLLFVLWLIAKTEGWIT